MIGHLFHEALNQNSFLIMSHRGFWGGNIIENTIESAIVAFNAGADIVEVDICKTTDDDYFLFHDGNEPKLFGHQKNFKTLSTEEVNKSHVLNSIGTPSGANINSLKQFLNWLPAGKLVNIDRSWEYWNDDAFFECIHASGKKDQLLFKSPVNLNCIHDFKTKGKGLMFVPIVKTREEAESVLSISELTTVGLELIITSLDSQMLDSKWLHYLREQKLMTIVNAENLGQGYNLLANLTDCSAILQDNDWSEIVKYDFDIIQTDWPNFLYSYRERQ